MIELSKTVSIFNSDGKPLKKITLQSIIIEYILKNHKEFPEDIIKMKDSGFGYTLLKINSKYSVKTN